MNFIWFSSQINQGELNSIKINDDPSLSFFLVLRSDRRIGNACQIPNGMIDRLPFWVIYDTAMNNAICDKIYINYMSKSQMHPRILKNDHCHGNGTVATDRTRSWYHNKRIQQQQNSQCDDPRALFQYPISRLIVRSRKVSKPRGLYLCNRSEIWQTHW